MQEAFRRIIENAKRYTDDAKILGVNVQEFITNGKRNDKRNETGSAVWTFVYVWARWDICIEILRDISFRLAPIKELGALHMIQSTKASKLLGGVRGEKPSDIRSIVEYLERMSQLVIDFSEIQEIDINPLLVFEQGKGSKVVIS